MNAHWKLVLAVIFLGLANVSALISNVVGGFSTSVDLDSAKIEPEIGVAFRLLLYEYEYEGVFLESRLVAGSVRSRPILYEDGKPLRHSARKPIREVGRGAYIHWGPTLIFSASDNTDPRINRRVYSMTYPLFVRESIQWGIAGLSVTILTAWIWRLGSDGRRTLLMNVQSSLAWARSCRALTMLADFTVALAIALAIVHINGVILNTTKSLPSLEPDSLSYWQWTVTRSPGYPLFLQAILAVFGDVRWIVPIQLNFLLISIVLMGWAMSSLFQSRFIGLLVIFSLFVTKPILLGSSKILSEALFIPLICLHVAAVFMLFRTKSRYASLLTGLTMGLAIAVRPAGYALLAGLPILLLLLRDRWRQIGGFLMGGLGLVLLLTVAFQHERHGLWSTQAFGGISLIGHVAPIITDNLDTGYPDLTRKIARRIGPLIQDLQESSSLEEHWRKTSETYNLLLWRHIVPEIDEYVRKQAPGLGNQERVIRTDDIAMAIAKAAIRDRPLWYLKHAFAHYYGLWNGFLPGDWNVLPIADLIARFQEQTLVILNESPDTYSSAFKQDWYLSLRQDRAGSQEESPGEWIDVLWKTLPYFRSPALEGVFIVTAMALLSLWWNRVRSDRVQVLVYLAVVLHCNLVFIASTTAGIERYTEPLRPVLVIEIVGALGLVASWAMKKNQDSLLRRSLIP
jgi:hypothetical protein